MQVKKTEVLASTPWLIFKKLHYVDPLGAERQWDLVSRSKRVNGLDGVDIFPLLKKDGEEYIVLVLQIRPPLGGLCLEFPAGLIDEGEAADVAAVRELKEETGYTGKVTGESPIMNLEPGLTDENTKLIFMEIDGNVPENQNVKQALEDTEHIQVILAPTKTFLATITDLMQRTKCAVDAKLYTFAYAQQFWGQRASPPPRQ